MFDFLKNRTVNLALNSIKGIVVNPNIEGIGTVQEIKYADGKCHVKLLLNGLEDKPIDITCEDIKIGDDGSYVLIEKFTSNMPFVQNALNKFASQKFDIPEGSARFAVKSAKSILNL